MKKSIDILNNGTRWSISCKIFNKKNYIVHGVKKESLKYQRVDDIYLILIKKQIFLHHET